MKRLVIDAKAVVKNLEAMRRHAKGAAMYAVLTGDAHGAGLEQMALLLRDHGVTRFAISEPSEAKTLRKAGLLEEELLMLRSTVNRDELETLMDLGVVCSIGSAEAGMALNALAESRSTIAEAHVQIDSGMGYGGFVLDDTDKVLSVFQNLQNVAISGVYTHFQSASVKAKAVSAQLDAFGRVVQTIQKAGFETGVVHAAGSFSTIQFDFSHLDAVRVGSALLGRCKRSRDDGLQKVGYCEAAIEDVRWLPGGHRVGYEHPVRLKKPTRVATVAVGYQNGLGVTAPRPAGFVDALRRWRGRDLPAVRVAGQKARIVGRIGAMETLIDVTGLRCSGGDLAQLEMDPLFCKGMAREVR